MKRMQLLIVCICLVSNCVAGMDVSDKAASQLTIELMNELGVKATINVTGFTAGKDTYGDRNHDFITQELNYMGGEWSAQKGGRDSNFLNSRVVMAIHGEESFVLIPWQSFKSLAIQDGNQIIRLNDGTEYQGRLRTILKENTGSEEKVYELSGATSMTIVQMPKQASQTNSAISAVKGTSKGSQWRFTRKGTSAIIVTQPQFVYAQFHVTSGGGIFEENGFYETKISEQFGVAVKERGSISANISDFESTSIGGGGSDVFGMPVTVKAKDVNMVSGKLAVTPFGLEWNSNVYLNRNIEMAGTMPNGCTILFTVWRGGDAGLKLERIH